MGILNSNGNRLEVCTRDVLSMKPCRVSVYVSVGVRERGSWKTQGIPTAASSIFVCGFL